MKKLFVVIMLVLLNPLMANEFSYDEHRCKDVLNNGMPKFENLNHGGSSFGVGGTVYGSILLADSIFWYLENSSALGMKKNASRQDKYAAYSKHIETNCKNIETDKQRIKRLREKHDCHFWEERGQHLTPSTSQIILADAIFNLVSKKQRTENLSRQEILDLYVKEKIKQCQAIKG